ncbi:MAG TPA: hypothetical protein VFE59_12050 [Trebonia sp.]|nr:hypothetical protein [Trebonia sp.]
MQHAAGHGPRREGTGLPGITSAQAAEMADVLRAVRATTGDL